MYLNPVNSNIVVAIRSIEEEEGRKVNYRYI